MNTHNASLECAWCGNRDAAVDSRIAGSDAACPACLAALWAEVDAQQADAEACAAMRAEWDAEIHYCAGCCVEVDPSCCCAGRA